MLTYEEMLRMPRPASGHLHMDQRNRAKQFAPFDALRGFGESIRERAVVYTSRPVLMEDRKEELDQELKKLQCGMEVTVVWFRECREIEREIEREAEAVKGEEEELIFPPRKLRTERELSGMGQYESVTGKVEFIYPGVRIRVDETEILFRDIVMMQKLSG